MEYSLRQVALINPDDDMEGMREHFHHDASLNAQGLAVWMTRQQA